MPGKREALAQLEREAEDPNLWSNPQRAQQVMKRLNALKEEVAALGDADLEADLAAEAEQIETALAQRELKAMLSGPYDDHDALLAIHAGAGGTDAHDWAEMLQRMYLRWAEKRGYKTEILDFTPGALCVRIFEIRKRSASVGAAVAF